MLINGQIWREILLDADVSETVVFPLSMAAAGILALPRAEGVKRSIGRAKGRYEITISNISSLSLFHSSLNHNEIFL
jgi:hypothetical protein